MVISTEMVDAEVDAAMMRRAVANAARVQGSTAPNPGVGAVVVAADGQIFDGATEPPPGRHAERVALDAAGDAARGSTVYTTLEPCSHTGRTGPCSGALIEAGVARVVVGIGDPDPLVAGQGMAQLAAQGIATNVGVEEATCARQLAGYLTHRRTGRPLVVLKLAASIDGRTAAPDATSQWITGDQARTDAHRLRAESDAILVGAGTVRADDPSLTVRHVEGEDPLRVVLGAAPADAKVHPCMEYSGELGALLDQLGQRGVLQIMVEGGATVAGAFHRAGLVDRYEVYLAPVIFGGEDGVALFAGAGAATMADVWRGTIDTVTRLGDDIRVTLLPSRPGSAEPEAPLRS